MKIFCFFLARPISIAISARSQFAASAKPKSYNWQYRQLHTVMNEKPQIAVVQMCSTSDVDANFEQCRVLARLAKEKNAALLSFPECFEFMGIPGSGDSLALAEPLTGTLFSRYRGLAKEFGLWLSLGGFHESSETPNKIFNTHAIISSDGEIVASYHKLHLFDVDVDGGFKESKSTIRGDSMLVVKNTPGGPSVILFHRMLVMIHVPRFSVGNLGVATCYDLRFPELFTALREAGAQVLLVPSAFMPTTGRAHWEVLLRARAIENQCYVVAAAQYGQHNSKRASYGHALIVDPWGEILQVLCMIIRAAG
jgi:predicted amidohydrolase